MTGPDYPDQAEWPRYWRAIRTLAVSAVAVMVIIGGGSYLPRPDALAPRIAVEFALGLLAVTASALLSRRINEWWERRTG